MPIPQIPKGENPSQYDGYAVYELEFTGSHGKRESIAAILGLAQGLKHKIEYEGDGRIRFQVKGNGYELLLFDRRFDEFIQKYGGT